MMLYAGDLKIIVKKDSEESYKKAQLYNITADKGETTNLAQKFPLLTRELGQKAKAFRLDLLLSYRRNCPSLAY
jgi:hypothetical protein